MDQRIKEASDSLGFRAKAVELVNELAESLEKMHRGSNKTIKNPDLGELRKKYRSLLDSGYPVNMKELRKEVIDNSIHLHNPKYMGHQVPPPYTENILSDWITSVLNNGTAVSEMGQVGVAMEQAVTDFLCSSFGLPEGSGFLTSGGSLGNLTALLAMREYQSSGQAWEKGGSDFAIMVSEEAHYSVSRSASIMGWGQDAVISIPCKDHKADPDRLEETLKNARKRGKNVVSIVANSCSTSLGAFDDLVALGEFAKKEKLWFHVDAAHGGPMIFSKRHKSLFKGVSLADSLVFDFHKLLHTPSLVTAVIFKNRESSFAAFDQTAKYLWRDDLSEMDFEIGKRTLECTRDIMSIKAFSSLAFGGRDFLENHIDCLMDITGDFAKQINESDDFELAAPPETNIICFRYIGTERIMQDHWIREQSKIRNALVENGEFYIVKTNIRGEDWLRCCLMNPKTDGSHIQALLQEIREVAKGLLT